MKGPILIGLLVGFALVAGCAKKQAEATASVVLSEGTSPDLTWSIEQSPVAPNLTASVPVDEQAKRLGEKVFATSIASVRRSPRNGAEEFYRVPAGTPLFVSPTADRKWLQVRMSKGRTGYVRTDETSAAMALALAQERLNDKQRLSPRPKSDSEPDDGKANEPNTRDPGVDEAIHNIGEAVEGAEGAFDRLRAEVAGFQGSSDTWATVKTAVAQELTTFQGEVQDVSAAIQALTSLSGKLSANERSAFQSMVAAQGEVVDLAQEVRQTLNQMTDGSDWTSLITALDDQVRALGSAMDALRTGLSRL